MNAIFICVSVLDKMCFHMLNLCWFKHRKIFECFSCFWKVFCSSKTENLKKPVLPCFCDSVAGQSSRMPQSRDRGSVLATCSQVEGPVARGTQRFSWLSSRLSREWDFQSRKTLRKFFKSFGLKCFGGCIWRLTSAVKNACFAQWGQFFKIFFSFPSNFLWLFIFSLNCLLPKRSV